LFYQVLVKKLG